MWIAILICSIVIFFVLSFIVLPKYFLRICYAGLSKYENIEKVVNEKYTSATVYKFDDERYVDKYALLQKNGYKEVICKLQSFVKSIVYDVVLFDKGNRVMDILTVSEKIKSDNYTKNIRVSDKVTKVMLVIHKVNQTIVHNKYKKKYDPKGLLNYVLITSALFFALLIGIQFAMINIFGDVFYQDYIRTNMYWLVSFIGVVIYGLVELVILKIRKF